MKQHANYNQGAPANGEAVRDPGVPDDGASPYDREEVERLVEEANAYRRRGYLADVEFGRCLMKLRALHDGRNGGPTWEAFLDTEFDISDDRARQIMALTKLYEALEDAGIEPLTVTSHAEELMGLDEDLQIRAVKRGREIAEAEGKHLIARHLERARIEIEDEALAESSTDETGSATLTDEAKEAVRARGGIHIVLPESAFPEDAEAENDVGHDAAQEAVLPCHPGRLIAPYDEELHDLAKHAAKRATEILTRADLDEVAEFVWHVLVPDAWEPVLTWHLPEGDIQATYRPDRLGAPSAPVSVDKKFEKVKGRVARARAATVLVAPGVDPLAPDLPERIVRSVVEAVGTDPERRYLFLTAHPARAASFNWPPNAFVCVTAHDAASAGSIAETVATVREESNVCFVLVLRDAHEDIPKAALKAFAGVLIRGKKTKQEAYDSVFNAVPYDRVHVAREVKARPLGFAALTTGASTEEKAVEVRTQRRFHHAARVKTQRDPKTGASLPPTIRSAPDAGSSH